jgi:hypothetical protein
MKLAREETKIKVTGKSFYRKNNLKFKGRNRNRNRGKKFGTRNRNLGKMARFRNNGRHALVHVAISSSMCPCPRPCSMSLSIFPCPCPCPFSYSCVFSCHPTTKGKRHFHLFAGNRNREQQSSVCLLQTETEVCFSWLANNKR